MPRSIGNGAEIRPLEKGRNLERANVHCKGLLVKIISIDNCDFL